MGEILKVRALISKTRCDFVRCYSTSLKDDYQYLPRSQIPMLHFQPSLPRLPIPDLSKTCSRYLASVKPIATDEEFKNTAKLVQDFESTVGPDLQEKLKAWDSANKHTSYISQPWFEMYLSDRQPLPVNYNPLLLMKADTRAEYNKVDIRATNLIISALRFYKSLKAQTLGPEVFHLNPKKSDTDKYRKIIKFVPSSISTYVSYVFKAYPLDMSQYHGLFGATRIPEIGKDRIERFADTRHLIVIRRGNFYRLDVLDSNGNIEGPQILHSRLSNILSDNATPISANPLGVLTSENRDNWAKVRQHFISLSTHNRNALNEIDSALFCVCLDDAKFDENNPTPAVENFLYGGEENRWFDKSLSLVIGADGTAGINFEHSWGDGVAVLRFFHEIYNETTSEKVFVRPGETSTESSYVGGVQKLEFDIDDAMAKSISDAKLRHKATLDSLEMNIFQEEAVGRKFCKKYNLSPDSFMQLGFQLAFYKQNQTFVGTYESCSTAAFRHGRTETMRPCTEATKSFCINAEKPEGKRPSKQELRAIIDQCSKLHSTLTKDAAMGQGFDRHLFGLRTTAQRNGLDVPELYKDELYRRLNYSIISTSTLASPALLAGGFGPVVSDGYGIGYNIQDNLAASLITNYKSKRNGSDFIQCLKESYNQIRDIVESAPPPAAK